MCVCFKTAISAYATTQCIRLASYIIFSRKVNEETVCCVCLLPIAFQHLYVRSQKNEIISCNSVKYLRHAYLDWFYCQKHFVTLTSFEEPRETKSLTLYVSTGIEVNICVKKLTFITKACRYNCLRVRNVYGILLFMLIQSYITAVLILQAFAILHVSTLIIAVMYLYNELGWQK